jgi:hypothetical protein
MLPGKLVRPVFVALGVLLVSTGAVVTLVPFESWVCSQLFVDVVAPMVHFNRPLSGPKLEVLLTLTLETAKLLAAAAP